MHMYIRKNKTMDFVSLNLVWFCEVYCHRKNNRLLKYYMNGNIIWPEFRKSKCAAQFMMTKICVLCIEYEFSVTSVLFVHSMVWPIKTFIFIHCQHELYVYMFSWFDGIENPHACHFISIWFDRCNTYYFMFLFLFLIDVYSYSSVCGCECLDEFLFLTLRSLWYMLLVFVVVAVLYLLSNNFVPSVLSIDFK